MSPLGFGDITFASDLGRIFSSIVLLSGIVMLLVVFPFTFIEFFCAPWMRAQKAARCVPTRRPMLPLPADADLVLFGRDEPKDRFLARHGGEIA